MALRLKKKEKNNNHELEIHNPNHQNDDTAGDASNIDTSVTCISGASCESFQLSGQRVEIARTFLSPILNIDPDANVLVNGIECSDDHVLESGDQLEFVKKAGEKGATGYV